MLVINDPAKQNAPPKWGIMRSLSGGFGFLIDGRLGDRRQRLIGRFLLFQVCFRSSAASSRPSSSAQAISEVAGDFITLDGLRGGEKTCVDINL